MRLGLVLGLAVAACAAGNAPESPRAGSTVFLSPTDHLERASMALRGIRPSLEDLHAVAADPTRLPAIVDGYLDSPEFGATVRELHNEVFLLRAQRMELTPAPFPALAGKSFTEIGRSLAEEPLRLIEDVVMSNQPYTNIVTAGYTMADDTVAAVWGLPHSADPGWERTVWFDGRPDMGILASSYLWARHRSAATNYNRGRANMVARTLLCHDFLAGDVVLDTKVDLSDPAVVANAVVENPSCAACHQTLDPLASYFFANIQGVVSLQTFPGLPIKLYDAKNAGMWLFTNGRPPRFFGKDVPDLAALGPAIASDPRFAQCAAIHFASYLTEVPEHQLPAAWIAELQTRFVAAGYNAKQLAKAIVLSDRFRVSHDEDGVRAEGIVGYQKVRPAQLARMLYDLTGFTWTGSSDALIAGMWRTGSFEYLDDDWSGFRVLAGGIDSFFVTQPVHTMSATSSLATQRAAYLAATYAVDHGVVPATKDDTTVRAKLAEMHGRIFGELEPDIEPTYELFQGALAHGDTVRRAWIITLTAMLSDLRALYY